MGQCRDGTGKDFDFAQASVADLEECMSLCSKTAHGGALVGINFGHFCNCLFTDGFLNDSGEFGSDFFDFEGMGFDFSPNNVGIGEVTSHDSVSGVTCYRVSHDTVSV